MKRIVILTGAGISKESGINTFRDTGGTWEQHDIEEVASIQGWYKNPQLVLDFYNMRRKALESVSPNPAHIALVQLESKYKVHIITQNVDDLHHRAGSSNIIQIHGSLKKMRSSTHEELIYDCNQDIKLGDFCELGSQLRPHIVWFGEPVPLIEKAVEICAQADIFIVVGTSLQVYPAAGLLDAVSRRATKYIADVNIPNINNHSDFKTFEMPASIAVPLIVNELMQG